MIWVRTRYRRQVALTALHVLAPVVSSSSPLFTRVSGHLPTVCKINESPTMAPWDGVLCAIEEIVWLSAVDSQKSHSSWQSLPLKSCFFFFSCMHVACLRPIVIVHARLTLRSRTMGIPIAVQDSTFIFHQCTAADCICMAQLEVALDLCKSRPLYSSNLTLAFGRPYWA